MITGVGVKAPVSSVACAVPATKHQARAADKDAIRMRQRAETAATE